MNFQYIVKERTAVLLQEARILTVIYWICAYALVIVTLRPILLAATIDKIIVQNAYMYCICVMPGLGLMSLVEIDMVIRFQTNDLGDGSHEHDVGCFARRGFLQKMMPILVGFITICIIALQCTYMHTKDSLSIGMTFTIM